MQNLFDEIKVPQEELDHIVNEKLDIIRKKARKKRKRTLLYSLASAAACIVLLVILSVSNPVLAAQIPLIGHLFEKVEDKQPYYRNMEDNTVQTMPETGDTENNVNGIKISLSEIYCNTEALYMTVMIESEDTFPEYILNNMLVRSAQIPDLFMLDAAGVFDFTDQRLIFPLQVNGEYMDEHTFVGSTRIDFTLGYSSSDENGNDIDFVFPDTIPESFHLNMDIKKIYTFYETSASDSWETYTLDGPWSFEADVTVKQTEKIIKEVNDYAPNGVGITTAEKGEYEILLNYGYDETMTEYDVDSLQSVILDADGKYMTDRAGMLPIGDFNASKIHIYYLPADSDEEWMSIQEKLAAGEPADFIKELAIHHTEIDFE